MNGELVPGAKDRGLMVSILERAYLSIIRDNRERGTEYVARCDWRLWRLRLRFTWKRSDQPWGRFGGGWNWKLGAQWGRTCVLLSLLVCELRLEVVNVTP